MTDTPSRGSMERFTAPIPIRIGEDAERSDAARGKYRLTGAPSICTWPASGRGPAFDLR